MAKTKAQTRKDFINGNELSSTRVSDRLQDDLSQYTDDRGTSDGQLIK